MDESESYAQLTVVLFCFRIPTLYPSIFEAKRLDSETKLILVQLVNGQWKLLVFPSPTSSASFEQTFSLKFCLWLPFFISTEADYTLDDSFWNEESPVGMGKQQKPHCEDMQTKRTIFLFPLSR